jgi:biopolymer transport protein ExbB
MSNSSSKGGSGIQAIFAVLVIPIAIVIGFLIWKFVMGDPSGFEGGDPEKNPLPNHLLAAMYKGGALVPVLIGTFITVLTFSIERMITIGKSKGTGRIETFIGRIRTLMANGDLNGAKAECAKQRGSIANVVSAGIDAYRLMENDKELDKERKLLAIQKELEEATTLELPMLSKNLVIISTIASIATLLGLLGTVIGMIRAFSALATAGAPDAVALSTGISEALNNTALGIGTSAVAIIMYNFFTSRIDNITYGIDEAGYSIVQSFASRYKSA